VWTLVGEAEAGGELTKDIVVRWHATKKKVAEDIESLHYNTAIAALMELVNHMKEAGCRDKAMIQDLVVMLAPFAPHFAEENWERLGNQGSVFETGWPAWDEDLVVPDELEIPVQVSGKTRSKVRVPRGSDRARVLTAAMADATVQKFVAGKEIRKVIFVPDRLINIVVG
jgi:leucyl-tRNA synthetase